jgi:hypothetical protein
MSSTIQIKKERLFMRREHWKEVKGGVECVRLSLFRVAAQ